MPRTARGKPIVAADGEVSIAAKNPNGDGSVYFEAQSAPPASEALDARQLAARIG